MKIKIFFITLFIFCAIIFYFHARIVGSAVWGDGIYYYNYVRALVVDHGFTRAAFSENKYSFGSSLFWLIPFYLVHIISRGNGYELIYQLITGWTSVGFGILGLYICFKILTYYFDGWISFISVIGLYFSSNLFFYTAVDPINSHAVSFFTSSTFVYLFLKYFTSGKGKKQTFISLILGLITGLLVLIRNQDIIFALPVIVYFIFQKKYKQIVLYITGVGVMLIPQFILWYRVYGQLNSPYLMRGEKFYLFSPHFLDVLISSNNGLIYTTPIILFCLFGLFLFRIKKNMNNTIYYSGLALFTLQTFIIGSWQYWNGGEAYGGRMFISLMPFFMAGLAGVIFLFKKRSFQLLFISFFALTNSLNILSFLFLH